MGSSGESGKLHRRILEVSLESVSFQDMGRRVLPILHHLFNASSTMLYRRDGLGRIAHLAGGFDGEADHYAPYYAEDPMQEPFRRENPKIGRISRFPEWKSYLKSGAYQKFMRPRDVHDFLHLRLGDFAHHESGMIGILIARSPRQSLFGSLEERSAASVFRLLDGLARRCLRWEERENQLNLCENIIEGRGRAQLALDLSGGPLWTSRRAAELLQRCQGLSEALSAAARYLGAALAKADPSRIKGERFFYPRAAESALACDFCLKRGPRGELYLGVEIEDGDASPFVREAAALHRLTAAEARVLALLGRGLSDREMSRRLFVSLATVHTHVVRVLDKLGVHSRVQASLIANGLRPDSQGREN